MHAESLNQIDRQLASISAVAADDVSRLKTAQEVLDTAKEKQQLHTQALQLLKTCLTAQPNVKADFEKLATMVLHRLWDETFRFEFVPVDDASANIKGVVPMVFENDLPYKMLRNGGGMRNFLGFVMRMAFLLVNPAQSPVIIWDEFGNNMDEDKFEAFMQIVHEIQQKAQLQTIMISHSNYGFDQVFQVKYREGASHVVKT